MKLTIDTEQNMMGLKLFEVDIEAVKITFIHEDQVNWRETYLNYWQEHLRNLVGKTTSYYVIDIPFYKFDQFLKYGFDPDQEIYEEEQEFMRMK